MEDQIFEKMKLDEELKANFTDEEMKNFLSILKSADSDAKRLERFISLMKGE